MLLEREEGTESREGPGREIGDVFLPKGPRLRKAPVCSVLWSQLLVGRMGV